MSNKQTRRLNDGLGTLYERKEPSLADMTLQTEIALAASRSADSLDVIVQELKTLNDTRRFCHRCGKELPVKEIPK